MTPEIREHIMRLADKWNIAPPAGYASPNAFLSGLIPTQPVPPLPEPVPFEITWQMAEDIDHHEDAYYQLGWRCISRHGRHALMCRDLGPDAPVALEFLILVAE